MSHTPVAEDGGNGGFEHQLRQLGRSGDANHPDVGERPADLYLGNGPYSPVFAFAARDGCGRHGSKR